MSFPSFLPNQQSKQIHEYSLLRSPKDSDSPWQMRKIFDQYGKQINALSEQVKYFHRIMDAKIDPEAKRQLDFDFFPFKIYTVPIVLRQPDSGSYSSDSNWRTVRVRGGAVLTETVDTASSWVYGTDLSPWPDSNISPLPWLKNVDYIVPTGSNQYWFWIEQLSSSISGTMYWLQQASASNVSSTSVQIPWSTFPSASTSHIPIGYVDNATSASVHQMFTRQYQRTDVVSTGGSGSYIPIPACLNGTASILYVQGYFVSGSI